MPLHVDLAPDELAAVLRAGPEPLLIDVRDPAEYAADHLAGSVNVPLTELGNALASYPQASRIVFVCQTGVRSRQAVTFARAVGYTGTVSLAGGLVAWRELGHALSDAQEDAP